ncbi:MAG: hypothetical protein A2Y81_13100 [Nitrospirae bacterium RBG_13_43_8]|nr:MAG: hypothetical protein A2Y81_13100 [Nitrospirae bacterium RBG_13_43_8]
MRSEIKDLLRQRLVTYNIVADDFSIVNFAFSQQFTQAIQAKQTAEQLAPVGYQCTSKVIGIFRIAEKSVYQGLNNFDYELFGYTLQSTRSIQNISSMTKSIKFSSR